MVEAFLATWSRARRTYGQATPAAGTAFDQSASLRGLRGDVVRAEPGTHWQGGAAAAYSAANADHAQVLGKLAELDARLAAEIDRSAQVVTAGRAELDNVRDWVLSAASSVPPGQTGDLMKMPIVSKGVARLSEVMLKSNAELNAIGASIQQIGAEYGALGVQKFGSAPAQ